MYQSCVSGAKSEDPFHRTQTATFPNLLLVIQWPVSRDCFLAGTTPIPSYVVADVDYNFRVYCSPRGQTKRVRRNTRTDFPCMDSSKGCILMNVKQKRKFTAKGTIVVFGILLPNSSRIYLVVNETEPSFSQRAGMTTTAHKQIPDDMRMVVEAVTVERRLYSCRVRSKWSHKCSYHPDKHKIPAAPPPLEEDNDEHERTTMPC